MSTTTIRLPVDLKARVADAARRSGTTPHGFILAAIAEKTDADLRSVANRKRATRADSLVTSPARGQARPMGSTSAGSTASTSLATEPSANSHVPERKVSRGFPIRRKPEERRDKARDRIGLLRSQGG